MRFAGAAFRGVLLLLAGCSPVESGNLAGPGDESELMVEDWYSADSGFSNALSLDELIVTEAKVVCALPRNPETED